MNQQLAAELIRMKADDLRLRDELLGDGSLSESYHPRWEALHKRNAARLRQIIAQQGWPGNSLVGEAACEAACWIVKHDIAEPSFQRAMLDVLREQSAQGEVKLSWVALLEDGIRMFEGRPQLYGTNANWNERGELLVGPIEDPAHLDERRASVGLPPFREPCGLPPDQPPLKDPVEFHRRYLEWTRRVGWRK